MEHPTAGAGPSETVNERKASFMEMALEEARKAESCGEVPIGAILVHDGEVLARAGNRTIADNDPTAHAEILVIRQACAKLGSQRLPDCDLYVTLEPCPMCAAAISFARIRRLYYGAADIKGGAVESGPRLYNQTICHHAPEVYSGISERQSAELLKFFFQSRRE
ncbi:tRNA(adenine34) deaminase [Cohaesibacter marisflavi]|uniref:tRNA-specific adenosine deaminase n=1 Tax=Cohaesibacter marisflavi TaxID=655353 RepID=A0A1I5ERB9_9HYPH|nr:nucleoside deaminase [Cohaesibacter marisflavi]SFO13979.1 tRNA(adenine34) deaminase [Cohaesibacter marisflavi]